MCTVYLATLSLWPMGLALDLEDYHPSVLLHCCLGHLTCKIVSEMTYNVSSDTLNHTIPYHTPTKENLIGISSRFLVWEELEPPVVLLSFQNFRTQSVSAGFEKNVFYFLNKIIRLPLFVVTRCCHRQTRNIQRIQTFQSNGPENFIAPLMSNSPSNPHPD